MAPADRDHLCQRLRFALVFVRPLFGEGAVHVRIIEDEPADPFRAAHGVGDGGRSPLAKAENREALEP